MYKICFFVPEDHKTVVKQAMFSKGGGKIGNYDCCAWECLGEGQFRPLEGSDAYIGTQDALETVAEFRVEMVCADDVVQDVIAAMKEAHPYETPAYDVFPLADL